MSRTNSIKIIVGYFLYIHYNSTLASHIPTSYSDDLTNGVLPLRLFHLT